MSERKKSLVIPVFPCNPAAVQVGTRTENPIHDRKKQGIRITYVA